MQQEEERVQSHTGCNINNGISFFRSFLFIDIHAPISEVHIRASKGN